MKLLENTFRHVNIALVNELAMFAGRPRRRHLGGDRRRGDQAVRVHAVLARARASAGTASRSTRRYLSWRVAQRRGFGLGFVQHALEVNNGMPEYVAQRVGDVLNSTGNRCAARDSSPSG